MCCALEVLFESPAGPDYSSSSQSFNMVELESIGIRALSHSVCPPYLLVFDLHFAIFESIGLQVECQEVGRLGVGLRPWLGSDPSEAVCAGTTGMIIIIDGKAPVDPIIGSDVYCIVFAPVLCMKSLLRT